MKTQRFAARTTICLLALLFCQPAQAENWPQWRGAKLDGVSGETGLPHAWSRNENVLWRLPLPGPAGSTPVVWGERIFLSSAEGQQLVLMAIGTDGKHLWKKVLADHNETVRGDEGNYASPSPSTDGKHVWSLMGTGDFGCCTVDGNEAWKFNLQDRYGKFEIQFGMASTPVLDGDRLYLQLIHTGGAQVVALDKLTGKEIWRRRRPSDARDECLHSYASPMLYRDGEREFLLTHGADYAVAHSLADGQEIWRCGGLNPSGRYNPTLRFVASPLAVPGLVVVPSAKHGPLLAIDPASKGDITDSEAGHLWTLPKDTPDVPSPLYHDGLVYICHEEGMVQCLDAKTGKTMYHERAHPGRHRASPVYADGKIFVTARDGTLTVFKAGGKYEILAQNTLGEQQSASPAISGGRIYLRTFDALYAIGSKDRPAK